MPHLTELSSRAHVYRFGARWHWKCGADRAETGRCLGGPAKTVEDAYRAAYDHITDEHCELLVVPVDPDAGHVTDLPVVAPKAKPITLTGAGLAWLATHEQENAA